MIGSNRFEKPVQSFTQFFTTKRRKCSGKVGHYSDDSSEQTLTAPFELFIANTGHESKNVDTELVEINKGVTPKPRACLKQSDDSAGSTSVITSSIRKVVDKNGTDYISKSGTKLRRQNRIEKGHTRTRNYEVDSNTGHPSRQETRTRKQNKIKTEANASKDLHIALPGQISEFETTKKLVTSASAQNPPSNRLETQLSNVSLTGANQLKKEIDNTLGQAEICSIGEIMKSVGALFGPNGLVGTVFRVGTNKLMTNWHVIADIINPMKSDCPDFSRLEERNVYVTFTEVPTYQVYRIYLKKEVVFSNENLDIAVLEVKKGSRVPNPLFLCNDEIEKMELGEVSFVGYGHPMQQTKRLDPKCEIIPFGSAIFEEAFSYVDAHKAKYNETLGKKYKPRISEGRGYEDCKDKNRFSCSCYLEHGGSGSPALTTKDPKSIKVVGILSSGTPEFVFVFQTNSIDRAQFPMEFRFETAIRMSSIYKSIKAENSVLAKDIFPGEV